MVISQQHDEAGDVEERKRIHFKTDKNYELESTLADIHMKQKEALVAQEAKQRGYHYLNLKNFQISTDALLMLDRQWCGQEHAVCFFYQNDQIRIGSTRPDNPVLTAKLKELEETYRAKGDLYLISEESLDIALKKYDAVPKALGNRDEGMELTEDVIKKQQERVTSVKKLNELLAKSQTTEILSLIIGAAIKSGASDLHVEAEAEDVKIRMRIDGVLHDVGILPTDTWPKVISRVKLIAGLKLNIINKPQDGRFSIYLTNDKIEVRVSTVPTSYGESVVMRLLKFSVEALEFERLGLTGFTYAVLQREVSKPNGMIIATGPTGSGKTTTLYAILHKLNDPGTKILTLEDPIEYKIKGINQTQVNPGMGMDFAKGLRSVLRQDPDIIMVGEIRDLETADTAINAALTGHLVLSTLHTNSAAGALPRFLAMGSKNFLLAPSINAIIGQRLVRRLCENCKEPGALSEDEKTKAFEALGALKGRTDLGVPVNVDEPEKIQFFTAKGCVQCNDFGFRGRIGIFEILTMSKDLEKLILAGNLSEYGVQDLAREHGMITMLQDGILKAAQGITAVSEVMRQAE